MVFGKSNYKKWKQLIKQPYFEYSSSINYLELLNPLYFYDLPNFSLSVPQRHVTFFFADDPNNTEPGGNPLGSTEAINVAERMYEDWWNSAELDLKFALEQY